jgi:hypothetical protein
MFVVDAHVHFHRTELIAPTLRAALGNFSRVTDVADGCAGALLLAQARSERVFEWLCEQRHVEEWSVEPASDEPQTLFATAPDGRSLAIVNGRQVRSACGLEVLAIGTCAEFEDGAPFASVVEQVGRSDALLVIPWGFGKWLGGRGAAVRAALERLDRRSACLGDNGGRLEWSREPRLMREARAKGFRVVPGTDPFPFGGDYRRVGRFGLCLDMSPPKVGLWRSIRALLTDDATALRTYGRRVDPARFVFNNIGIQLGRRLGWGSA